MSLTSARDLLTGDGNRRQDCLSVNCTLFQPIYPSIRIKIKQLCRGFFNFNLLMQRLECSVDM